MADGDARIEIDGILVTQLEVIGMIAIGKIFVVVTAISSKSIGYGLRQVKPDVSHADGVVYEFGRIT